MTSVKPAYLIALVLAVAMVVAIKVSNPYRKYSTVDFWKDATVASVDEVPQQALESGNRNGPVIMWAAIGANDISIIQALLERGADINESDVAFKGTPLTGAAGYSKKPMMITELVRLGANVNQAVGNGETALMIAAQYNSFEGMVSALIENGANIELKSTNGKTAMEFAQQSQNETAIKELERHANVPLAH